jgi:nucleotide-binding universal stress UspA family protein
VPVRVLLATDGGPAAEVARAAVHAIAWPGGTRIRVLGVLDGTVSFLGAPTPHAVLASEQSAVVDAARTEGQATLEAVATTLLAPDIEVEWQLVQGRAANRIVDAARAWPADLIVLGNRGRRAAEYLIRGSIGMEVVEQAPCPVLLARRERLDRVVVALDPEQPSDACLDVLRTTPLLRDRPLTLVGAVASDREMQAGAAALEVIAETVRTPTRPVEVVVAAGKPAAVVMDLVDERGADLLVTAAQTADSLVELLTGSVSRTLIIDTSCSILAVPHP